MGRTCYYDKDGKSVITDDGQPEGFHYDFRGKDLEAEFPDIEFPQVEEPKKRGRPKKK